MIFLGACSLAADDGVRHQLMALATILMNLMLKMADSGRGKGYYGDTADDLQDLIPRRV